ncbi:MAG: hypothetical protein WC553_02460 [Patescibacteria group bacterium]|jgi:hypothetical protein
MKKLELIPILAVVFVVAIGIWAWQSPKSSTRDVSVLPEPTTAVTAQIQLVIQRFMHLMADSNPTVRYITTQKNPSNFTIGTATQLGDGAWRTDTPAEWQRPVYVFQQTQYINEQCEVYEYEIDARNNQIVDIHVRYPEEIQNLLGGVGLNASQCASYGSLYIPTKTQSQIETIAMDFLSQNVSNFTQLQDDFTYQPSKENPVNVAAAHEWIWQDTSYKLPKGLTGDVYNYPTIRVILTSGGKLIHYFNSVGLFAVE